MIEFEVILTCIHRKLSIPRLLSISTHNLFQFSHDVRVHLVLFLGGLTDFHQNMATLIWINEFFDRLR